MWVIAAIFGIALLFMAWAAAALFAAWLTDRRMDEHWSSVEDMLTVDIRADTSQFMRKMAEVDDHLSQFDGRES